MKTKKEICWENKSKNKTETKILSMKKFFEGTASSMLNDSASDSPGES